MTGADTQAWLATLGRTPSEQLAGIEDLLRHAIGDRMSTEDRTICRTEAGKLRTQIREARTRERLESSSLEL